MNLSLPSIHIRRANPQDATLVVDVLREAARWLEQRGMPLWKEHELDPEQIAADVANELFYIAESSGDAAGVMRLQEEDPLFWPDAAQGEAMYIHRLAVRRKYAGGGVSNALLRWAFERTRSLGRRYLRLDTDAARPRLRGVYEAFGFRHRDDRRVGPYFVSRYELDACSGATTTRGILL
jgi:GNAT superfamily N-acetyltransferase